jgi:hypothetical protein
MPFVVDCQIFASYGRLRTLLAKWDVTSLIRSEIPPDKPDAAQLERHLSDEGT